jgi:hypothetical protein
VVPLAISGLGRRMGGGGGLAGVLRFNSSSNAAEKRDVQSEGYGQGRVPHSSHSSRGWWQGVAGGL